MPASSNPNIKMLELAVERLGTLVNEVVFLGGCATGLLLTDTAAQRQLRRIQESDCQHTQTKKTLRYSESEETKIRQNQVRQSLELISAPTLCSQSRWTEKFCSLQ